MVDFAAACTYSTHPGIPPVHMITKIELLVNGHKVIKSVSGKEARALAAYKGVELQSLGWYARQSTSGEPFWWTFPLLFGRYIGDKQYMLDLERYSNPQLRITWDAATTSRFGVTWNATSSPYARSCVQALMWKGNTPVGVQGYINSAGLDTWPNVVGATRSIEIPKGHNLYGVYTGMRYLKVDLDQSHKNTKIQFDNGDWVPLDVGYHELLTLDAMWHNRNFHSNIYTDHSSTDEVDKMFGFPLTFSSYAGREDLCTVKWNYGVGTAIDTTEIVDDSGAAPAMTAYMFGFTGRFPEQVIYIPVWLWSEDDEIGIDTKKYGRIDMKIDTDSSASTSAITYTGAEYVVPNGE